MYPQECFFIACGPLGESIVLKLNKEHSVIECDLKTFIVILSNWCLYVFVALDVENGR